MREIPPHAWQAALVRVKRRGAGAASVPENDQLLTLHDEKVGLCAKEVLTKNGPRPVLVVIGGAEGLSGDDYKLLRPLFDRGIGPAAERAAAVVLTGGTKSGVMELAGAVLKDRAGVITVGVAPRALVRLPKEEPKALTEATPLDPNHDYFVLSPGQTWGSETETLFALAEQVTGGTQTGVVVLANGGTTARHEALRFVKAGWPIVCLSGSGREADVLAAIVRRRGQRRRLVARALGWTRSAATDWGDLGGSDIEMHSINSPPELLFRRLSWRLSNQLTIKNAWSRWTAFDQEANRARRQTSKLQGIIFFSTVLLLVLSVIYGQGAFGRIRPLIIVLPVAIALSGALSEALLPARNWTTLRAAAEAVQRGIYRYWCRYGTVTVTSAEGPILTNELSEVDQFVVRSGVPLALAAPMRRRPDKLPASFDEFSPLTVRAYAEERLDDQLRYYRAQSRIMRIRETLAISVSAVFAAAATAFAAELHLALWVPLLIFLASSVTILQQRARWHDRIRLYSLTVAELEAVRGRAFEVAVDSQAKLVDLVDNVESVLEREQSGWLQNMSRAIDESARYPQSQLGEFE
jgi:predicted Rossmann-fold nucleotide-binding protein